MGLGTGLFISSSSCCFLLFFSVAAESVRERAFVPQVAVVVVEAVVGFVEEPLVALLYLP